MQSIILLYIKETDGRPADGAVQSRIGWEEIEDAHRTPYALRAERNWRKTKYADAGQSGCFFAIVSSTVSSEELEFYGRGYV